MRAFRHRDFRILWSGAFLSFMGGWIQNVAQGWLVYDLTHDAAKLALVTFCNFIPVSVFGPVAGAIADVIDKKRVLVACQVVFAAGALTLAVLTQAELVRYEHVLIVATVSGFAMAIEAPTRQSVVARVVPPEELSSAIPLQGMTFNLSRLLGPAAGGLLLAALGPGWCYAVNGLSYAAMVLALLAIRSDLRPEERAPQPILDLLTEGVRYAARERRLRALLLMESAVAMFGLPYLALMPAIVRDVLGMGKAGLGMAMSTIGIGAVAALALMSQVREEKRKLWAVRTSMLVFGLGLLSLGFSRSPWMAFPLFAAIGMAAITQFNTTNTLFQIWTPDRLRGRVLAMHVWALSGLNPMGAILFGWIASAWGVPFAIQLSGMCVLLIALWGWRQRGVLETSSEEVKGVAKLTEPAVDVTT